MDTNALRQKILDIPIPPESEQRLICEKIAEAFSLIEKVSISKENIEESVNATKSKILDLAIRGKLVPQDPNDEPASVLLERIRAEKEELIKQGKIKRDKSDSVIFKGDDNSYYERLADGTEKCIDEEIPFDLPESWIWARYSTVFIINPRNSLQDKTLVSFVPMPYIQDGFANGHSCEEKEWQSVKTGFTHFAENDVAVAKITPCFENRKSVAFRDLKNGYGAGTTELHIIRALPDTIYPEFVLCNVKTASFINDGIAAFSGAVGQKRIGKDFISRRLIALPPLAEQQKIVETVKSTFEKINKISTVLA